VPHFSRKERDKVGHPAETFCAGAKAQLFFLLPYRGPEGPLFHEKRAGARLTQRPFPITISDTQASAGVSVLPMTL